MNRCLVIFVINYFILFDKLAFETSGLYGHKIPPMKGAVWPKPKYQCSEKFYYKIAKKINITVTHERCHILDNAIKRYSDTVSAMYKVSRQFAKRKRRNQKKGPSLGDQNCEGYLQKLRVTLSAPCEELPYFGMDESYNLTIATVANLKSSSVWGILRGLESWTHLFYFSQDKTNIYVNKTVIQDAPRYLHRGLLIDTSRHYLSLSTLTLILDAMAMDKLNVLHWHIVDDESFPYQSDELPNLSLHGAFNSVLVYTMENIDMIVEYARDRGIRVVPEFDIPGHTRSWGNAYPDILTKCYKNKEVVDLGPMNPIENNTYNILKQLFGEVQARFPDQYLHIGGDEVKYACWESNPDLCEYIKTHKMGSVMELHDLFMKKVVPLLGKKIPIVWEDVFDEGVPLSKKTLIQEWKGDIDNLVLMLQSGFKVLYSSGWYLDNLKWDWTDMYMADPRQMARGFKYVIRGLTKSEIDNIVGGEACMWGELVNDHNIVNRIWPRASAVAEKLWSPETGCSFPNICIPDEVYSRLYEHVARMIRRGINAQRLTNPVLVF